MPVNMGRLVALLGTLCGLGFIVAQPAFGQTLAAAVLPTSRSVQVGTGATVFASIINAGTTVALGCRIALGTALPTSFSYQTTLPATNQPTGSPNTPVDIQPGATQTFLLSLTPSAEFAPTVVQFSFTCTNTSPAGVIVGVNTLLLSASNTPVPDIIAIAATTTADGIVNIPGPTGTGAFSVATSNLGAGAMITASADTGNVVLPVDLALCPTEPTTAACLSAPAATVTVPIDSHATPTFSIFVTGRGTVPFDPANNRVSVRFKDAGGVNRGETSVAVRTQTPTPAPTFFHALSDSWPLPDDTLLATVLPVLQALDCLPVASPSAMTFADAMSSIQSRLDQLAGAGALQQFLASNAQTDTATLAARAGGAMIANNGAGALAALLAAHQNDVTNPAHLVNAAGAAGLLGMPNEALALLDAADAMGGDFRSPMGFDGHAIALNNRGFALIQRGQYSAAQAPLASANSLEPFLAEARMNATIAQLCQGQDAAATFLSAVHRSPGQLTIDQIFDTSLGVAAELPALPYPATAERLRAYANTWGKIEADVLDKVSAAYDQRNQAHAQLVQEQQATPWSLLTIQRVGSIYGLGDALGTPTFDAQSPPGLSDLYAAVSQHDTTTFNLYDARIVADHQAWTARLFAAIDTCNAQRIPLQNCEPYLQVLDQGRTQVRQYVSPFLAQVGAYEAAVRAFVDPWSRTLTGLAANLSDQFAHQERESQAKGNVLFLYSGLVNRGAVIMGELATWWDEAQAPPDLGDVPLPNGPSLGSLDACPDALKGMKFQGSLFGAVDVTISCESVKAEISSPGLGPFAQLTVPRKGDWTVFMGVKGSLPGTSARFGVYIRGNDQSFTDAGIKSTQSFGAGPLKIESPFDMELGVAAAMQCPLGFCN